jgi:hypothetical protein
MSQANRPIEIAECIAKLLRQHGSDPQTRNEITVKYINDDATPTYGITVSPESQDIGIGTNERDDIKYTILIVRTKHSLGNDDHAPIVSLMNDIRTLFHRKRLTCVTGCLMYCTVDPSRVAIPEEWKKRNNSVLAVRVNALVRESREKE